MMHFFCRNSPGAQCRKSQKRQKSLICVHWLCLACLFSKGPITRLHCLWLVIMTASAVVAMDINLQKIRTSTTMLLGMTYCERRKCILTYNIVQGNTVIPQLCLVTFQKYWLSFAQNCNGNPASEQQQKKRETHLEKLEEYSVMDGIYTGTSSASSIILKREKKNKEVWIHIFHVPASLESF